MKNALPTSGRLRRRIASALLVLSVAVGALASTATPAQAASSIFACFQRPTSDPTEYMVRLDLRWFHPYQKVWLQTGQYVFLRITSAGPRCQLLPVPIAYQNFLTTVIVDYRYTQNGTTMAWFGWSYEQAAPGTLGYTQRNAVAKFNVMSSADGVGVHSSYWH